jgi:hypothetical protein
VEDLLLLERLASGQNGIGEVQLTQYLEFQVHGPIRFAEDVASVVVPESLRQVQVSMPASPTPVKLVSLVEKFCRKFDTMVDWAPPPPPGSLGAAATAAAAAADARRAMDHRSTVGTGGLERWMVDWMVGVVLVAREHTQAHVGRATGWATAGWLGHGLER